MKDVLGARVSLPARSARAALLCAALPALAAGCGDDGPPAPPGPGGDGGGGSGGGGALCAPGATVACYTGPAGTQAVGACRAGARTSDADGSSFGPCEGEVLPGPETCATPEDDDCDGAANEGGDGCACVQTGTNHTCARLHDGRVKCWGRLSTSGSA